MSSGYGLTGTRIQGDAAQRITVPKPRSMAELQSHAAKHFGHLPGRKLHHKGEIQMQHQGHVDQLKHDDVVIVEPEMLERLRQEQFPTTTHQDHYIKWPAQGRRPATSGDKPRDAKPVPFDGQSSYNVDYVKHPVSPRNSTKPPAEVPGRPVAFEGESMYQSHYPWHKSQPRQPLKGKPQREAHSPVPFDGTSSYKVDYVKHPARPRSAASRKEAPKDHGPPMPFEGQSTYNNDFRKHKASARQTPKRERKPTQAETSIPFEGVTEYQMYYLKHNMPKRELIHLEPKRASGDRSASVPRSR
eukprot:TRINITY_DN8224_c0_g1_i1.p1 TRINITY_DN8224_c0_g1~~TRINITY_DN8224_c0_g1_i1.p1  ORF type:complete len:301 (-),score=31.57 TRINITY_DN8224_c0_g1_i1:238-1140(-)